MERVASAEQQMLIGYGKNAIEGRLDSGTIDQTTDSDVLRDTFKLYGSALLCFVFLFCWLRRQFPRIYNIRKWVDDSKTYLADDQHGFFSWMWRVYEVTEDEMMDEFGMDALCFIRLIDMGLRLSLVGILNAIWLIPIYATAVDSTQTHDIIRDNLAKTTIGHVPSGSIRLYATVFASYVMFGYTMILILHEFDWYIYTRHKFLRKPLARHFAVFVRNVPPDYRSNRSLAEFFRRCFTNQDVLEARLAINAPNLTRILAQRDTTLANLEHALDLYERDGVRPRHRNTLVVQFNEFDSIDYYTLQLEAQNMEVARRIDQLEAVLGGSFPSDLGGEPTQEDQLEPCAGKSLRQSTPSSDEVPLPLLPPCSLSSIGLDVLSNHSEMVPLNSDQTDTNVHFSGHSFSEDQTPQRHRRNTLDQLTRSFSETVKKATSAASKAAGKATFAASNATSAASKVANRAVATVLGVDDGSVFPAGFVVFSNRRTTNAALQMIHHHRPFSMEVLEAPDPPDVFWGNVRRTHKDLEIGKLLSFCMTASACIFWTIPISFFASSSNANAVRENVKWLDDLFDEYPVLVPVTQQLAPLLVVCLNASLPILLGAISLFEGPICTGAVEASKFIKLAAFMIVQTFFVSAISGTAFEAITAILKDWKEIINLLSMSLPAQSTYFMQILVIMNTVTAGYEMFRVYPLVTASLRSTFGPNLTETQRSKAFMTLRPLNNPPPFPHADYTSRLLLHFLILLVFSVISPITPLVTGACFALMSSMFRAQFIYIYAPRRDSGGKLWANFIQIMLSCIVIAQTTIFGLLILKKASKQTPLFIPLPITTVLFILYIRQKHFRVASYLPTEECLVEDFNHDGRFESLLRGSYVQPQLAAERTLYPSRCWDSATGV